MANIIRKDIVYKLSELPTIVNNSFVVNNNTGLTGSIISRPVQNTLNVYKHFALVYGFDDKNVLWVIENNTNGVECITFSDFLNGQLVYNVEKYVTNPLFSSLILQRAKTKSDAFYDSRKFNCEHFVNFCHTGYSNSKQVNVTETIINVAISYYELKISHSTKDSILLESLNKTRQSLGIERVPELQKTIDENIAEKNNHEIN